MKKENKQKIITFDKSALKFICKCLDVPYNKDIIAFVPGKKPVTNIWDLVDTIKK